MTERIFLIFCLAETLVLSPIAHGEQAVEEKRRLPDTYVGTLPSPIHKAELFCKGCLVLEGPSYKAFEDPSHLIEHPSFADFPLLILVDDAKIAASSLDFLWTVFTRFEPARDIYAKSHIKGHHLSYKIPFLIDARMKPSYPAEVRCSDETAQLVDTKWNSYGIPN